VEGEGSGCAVYVTDTRGSEFFQKILSLLFEASILSHIFLRDIQDY